MKTSLYIYKYITMGESNTKDHKFRHALISSFPKIHPPPGPGGHTTENTSAGHWLAGLDPTLKGLLVC